MRISDSAKKFAAEVVSEIVDRAVPGSRFLGRAAAQALGSRQAKKGRYGTFYGKYAGKSRRMGSKVFIKRRGSRRVSYRRNLKARVNRLYRGHAVVRQDTGVVQGTQAVHLNVNNAPLLTTVYSCFQALVRKMFSKMGNDVVDCEAVLPAMYTGGVFTLGYRPSVNGSYSIISYAVVNTDSLKSIANALYLLVDNMTYSPGLELDVFVYERDNYQTQMYIRNLSFNILSKCSLKMQNRSVNVSGETQTDEVDKVPITGQVLSGKGNCPVQRGDVGLDFMGVGLEPVNIVSSSTPNTFGAVKPNAYDFRGVKYSKKLNLQPGDIKTESISSVVKVRFNSLLKVWISYRNVGGASQPNETYCPWGMFKLLSFEKLIGNTVADNQDIIVKYESELKMYIGLENVTERYAKPIIIQSK